jgi:cysteinyl-tRNA synthetase
LLGRDEILGLSLWEVIAHPHEVPDSIMMLVETRETARKEKDWKESDRLRDEIASKGWTVEDTSNGPKLSLV